MPRLHTEDGFTLPELLTAMAIAMIVSLATFALVETVMKRSGEVGARVETTATARTAMDQLTRQLRSQVCAKRPEMGTARSIDSASPTAFSVFTDFTNENAGGGVMPAPDLRTVTWDAAAKLFTETVVAGTRDTRDNTVTYPVATAVGTATPAPVGTSRQLLRNVVATEFFNGDRTKPIFFRYYRFPEAKPGTELPANVDAQPNVELPIGAYRPLNEAELLTVAKITVKFQVLPRNGTLSGATTLENEIYVRTADPNAQTPKPTCLTY